MASIQIYSVKRSSQFKLAEQITGDAKFFWLSYHSAGGRPEGTSARQERELRWRELRRKY
jgi:hypothetical protein